MGAIGAMGMRESYRSHHSYYSYNHRMKALGEALSDERQ